MLILGSKLEIGLDLPSLPLKQSLNALIPVLLFRDFHSGPCYKRCSLLGLTRLEPIEPPYLRMRIHPDFLASGAKGMPLKQSRLHFLAAEIRQSTQAWDLAAWRFQPGQKCGVVKEESGLKFLRCRSRCRWEIQEREFPRMIYR